MTRLCNHFLAYDTLCKVDLFIDEDRDGERLLAQSQALALEVQSLLNMYCQDSELSRMNAGYRAGVPYPISAELTDFLAVNLDMSMRSKGAFDPTVGPLLQAWEFLSESPSMPDPSDLEMILSRVGFQYIDLDFDRQTITFKKDGMKVDPGAAGKGYALKRVADHLKDEGVGSAVLDFGGNIYTIGGKKDAETGRKTPWRVGIKDPKDSNGVIGSVELMDQGVATSSWYEHCFSIGNNLCHHLLDPRTGMPKPLKLQSVSVISSDALYTDLCSTAFFVLGKEAGEKMVKKLVDQRGIDIEYVLVMEDGGLYYSQEARFKKIS